MVWTHESIEVLAAIIFTLGALLHLVRAVQNWALQLGPYSIPQWASIVAVFIAGYLSIHFWRKILG